jgi:hypothetical protein
MGGKAHAAVDLAKRALGESDAVWWTDGTPDANRKMVNKTGHTAGMPRSAKHRTGSVTERLFGYHSSDLGQRDERYTALRIAEISTWSRSQIWLAVP